MLNTASLKDNRDFRHIYAGGRQSPGRLVVLYTMPNGLSGNRLGVTAGKKVGNAVTRNRVKRWVKEAYRVLEPGVANGYDIVIVARAAAGALTRRGAFNAVGVSMRALLLKQGLYAGG